MDEGAPKDPWASQKKQNKRKSDLLGLCFSKARRLLVNSIIRSYFSNEDGEVFCYRCGLEIDRTQMLTLEHKDSWATAPDPLVAYLSLSNIAASHHKCNTNARRKRGGRDPIINRRPKNPLTGRYEKVGLNEKTSDQEEK
jgi:hypothetical protein